MPQVDRRRRRLLAQLAIAEHRETPTAEARAAIAGARQTIAASHGVLSAYRLRIEVAALAIELRALARVLPEFDAT